MVRSTFANTSFMAVLAFASLVIALFDFSFATTVVPALIPNATDIQTVEHAVDVGLNVDIDVLGIGQAISDSIHRASNREAFVKNLRNIAYYRSKSRYNVMVFNLQQSHSDRLRGVKFYASANYDHVIYGVWIFRSGTFENTGDGGYINWAFRGCFKRYKGKVAFRKHVRRGRCSKA